MVKENEKTTGQRLRGWRKSVPLKLMELSGKIKVSQGVMAQTRSCSYPIFRVPVRLDLG